MALTQGSTVVTLVSTTCSEILETEHRLCKDKDLWLAEERGLGAFREPQGPRPGRQQEKAALNCSRNLPWLRDRRHSHKETDVAGRGLGPRDTHAAPAKLPVRGRREGQSWAGESPKATSSLPKRVRTEALELVPKEKCNFHLIP